jgi:NADPH2:quinone reductase
VKVNRLLLGHTSVVGVGWGAFWWDKTEYLHAQWTELLPMIEAGTLNPVLGSGHPLAEAANAISELDERRSVGKVVLTVR